MGEVVEQRPSDHRFTDAAFVRADKQNWFSPPHTVTRAAKSSIYQRPEIFVTKAQREYGAVRQVKERRGSRSYR